MDSARGIKFVPFVSYTCGAFYARSDQFLVECASLASTSVENWVPRPACCVHGMVFLLLLRAPLPSLELHVVASLG